MIERPWGVVTLGAASVKAMPDLVRIRFKVNMLEQTPAESFGTANDGVRAVRPALRNHAIPDAAVQRSHLDLRSVWETQSGLRRFLGYRCQAAFSVESGNLENVQQLLVDLVNAGVNEIDAVDFDVRDKPELRAEARTKAVAAARAKAELYAAAAGVRVGPVLHIDDVDAETQGYKSHGSYSSAASDEDLAPGHVLVSAAVIIGFAIVAE